MIHPLRWRVGAAAAALAAVAFLAPGPRPAAAEPPKLPPGLALVPADAAFFAHADFAAVWRSKLGDSFRAAKAKEIEKALADVEGKTGLTPDMLKTVTLFFPHLKDPADFQSPVFYVTFTKPYDKDKIVASLKELAKDDQTQLVETESGVYEIRDQAEKKGEKKPNPKKKPGNEPRTTFVMKDPTAIAIAFSNSRKYLKPAPAGDGPQTAALKTAAGGATATVGINFLNFPDEIRGDNLPAEVRAFAPLFQSDAATATARIVGDKVNLDVRFRSGERRKVIEAEKSLGAGQTLLQAALGFAVGQLEKSKEANERAVLPLVKEALEVVKAAKVSSADGEAVVTAATRTDLPVGPLVQTLFGGGSSGPRAAATRAQDQNNLKQIGLAMHNYHDTYNGFPPAALVDKRGKPMLSWRVLILPYIEQQALYQQFKLDEPWDSEHNKKVFDKQAMPKVFALPGVTKDGEKTTHYQVFVGNGAAFDRLLPTKLQSFADGTSNTILVATAAKAVPWTKPDDIEFDKKADLHKLLLFNQKGNGMSTAFADGSVRFIKDTITEDMLRALVTKSGGEVIGNIP